MSRIQTTFDALRANHKKALITFIMGGDPSLEHSQNILNALPEAGADLIEIGMPFTDPMADGPSIQAAGLRALEHDTNIADIFTLVKNFRETNKNTPIILMGYFNPIFQYGCDEFVTDAVQSGIDGLIIVDLPPEEDSELRAAFDTYDLALIRLATPTTDAQRLPKVVEGTKGFVYYVSMTGITGASFAQAKSVKEQVSAVRAASNLPVVVGFGVKTPERAREVAQDADGVVVGTAIVKSMHDQGLDDTLAFIRSLADGAHG